MPIAPLRPCKAQGCAGRAPVGERYCPECKKKNERDDGATRAKAHERGYDAQWHRYRNMFLREHPLCAVCEAAAEIVDHVVPVKGRNDPLFYEPTNHQSLCRTCHDKKHRCSSGAWSSLHGKDVPPADA